MYFALGAEARMGLRGWSENGNECMGAAISALAGVTRKAVTAKTKVIFAGETRLRRAARGTSFAGTNGS